VNPLSCANCWKIMKNLKSEKTFLRVASVVLASTVAVIPVLSEKALAADPAVVQEAQQLCIENANSKGFTLKQVVEAGASDRVGKDAKIVLSLDKGGQEFKQTCYYDKTAKSVFFDGDVLAPLTAPEATFKPNLWWALLPIIGLPLLLLWGRNRDAEYARTAATTTRTVRYYDAIIRTADGTPIQVYEDPAYSARILRTIEDGQSVRITGRETDDWFELVGGGWLPKQYVRTSTRA
jgi:hypothetical protein